MAAGNKRQFVHNFGTSKKNSAALRRLAIKKRVWPLNSLEFTIMWWHLFASAEDVHRRIADRFLHFDIKNICQIYTEK